MVQALLPIVGPSASPDFEARVDEARQRVETAAANATEEKRLYNRTVSALEFLYMGRDMGYIIYQLKALGKNNNHWNITTV